MVSYTCEEHGTPAYYTAHPADCSCIRYGCNLRTPFLQNFNSDLNSLNLLILQIPTNVRYVVDEI